MLKIYVLLICLCQCDCLKHMDLRLKDKVIIITGGSKGIGEAAVRAFAKEESKVVIAGRSPNEGKSLAAETGGIFIEAELSQEISCNKVVEETMTTYGQIDVLVNNAGYNDGVDLEQPPKRFMSSLQANLSHVYTLTHLCREQLRANKGSVVNIGSKVAVTGQGSTSGYAAAKGAMNALTREWAIALAPEARVNAVLPAECITPQYQRWFNSLKNPEDTRRAIEQMIPLGHRMTTPEELAAMIVFLASPVSSHTTGQIIFVDGGYTHLDRAVGHDHLKWSEN